MSAGPRYLVLTAVGRDRPGLVQRISRTIHEAGANLEDSRMAILGGEFALILLASGSPESMKELHGRRGALETELELTITLKETTPQQTGRNYLPYRLRVTGVDRPGIVARVSAILAGRDINVASLESRLQHAPLSGTPMFVLNAELQIPSEVALADLRRSIAAVCEEENFDFWLESG